MITGELKSKVDRIRKAFRSGGISNGLKFIWPEHKDISLHKADRLWRFGAFFSIAGLS